MKKSILLLSGVIVILSILHVSDTKLRLWDSPDIPSQYIGSGLDIKIETDREFFIFDLFINFFTNIDFNSQTVEASLEEKEVDINTSSSEASFIALLAKKEDEKAEVVVDDIIEEVKELQTVIKQALPSVDSESIKEELVQEEEPKKEIDPNQIFLAVKEMPEFAGGDVAIQKYIQNNTNYPDVAKRMGLQGYVYINYIVDQVGDVIDVNLKKGVHPVLDNEALRVVASLPKYKNPGKEDGIPVKVQLTIPVNFVYQSGNPVFDAWWDALSLEEKEVFGEEESVVTEEEPVVSEEGVSSGESSFNQVEAVVSENTTSESLLDNTQESFVSESTENQSTSSNIEEQISMIKKFPAKGTTIALMIRYLKSGELTFDDLCSIRDSREGKSIKSKHLKKMIKRKKKASK